MLSMKEHFYVCLYLIAVKIKYNLLKLILSSTNIPRLLPHKFPYLDLAVFSMDQIATGQQQSLLALSCYSRMKENGPTVELIQS